MVGDSPQRPASGSDIRQDAPRSPLPAARSSPPPIPMGGGWGEGNNPGAHTTRRPPTEETSGRWERARGEL